MDLTTKPSVSQERTVKLSLRSWIEWLTPLSIGIIAYLAGFSALLFLPIFESDTRQVISDLGQAGAPVIAAIACFRATRKAQRGRAFRFWGLLLVGSLASAIGNAVWAYMELFLDIEAPVPSPADVAWAVMYIAWCAALLMQVRIAKKPITNIAALLDAPLFVAVLGALMWRFGFAGALVAPPGNTEIITQAYWLGSDALLLFALASITIYSNPRSYRVSTILVTGGILAQTVADAVFGQQKLTGVYQTGAWIDALWVLAPVLIGLGAISASKQSAQHPDLRYWNGGAALPLIKAMQAALPYASVPVAALLLIISFNQPDNVSGFSGEVTVVIALGLLLLTLLRQLFMLIDNGRLNQKLLCLSRDLEKRVRERTQRLAEKTRQLEALNHISEGLKLSRNTQEVSEAGIRLLCEAGTWPGGVICLRDRTGGLAVQYGFGQDRGLLAQMQSDYPYWAILAEILDRGIPTLIPWSKLAAPASRGSSPDSSSVLAIPLCTPRNRLGLALVLSPVYPSLGEGEIRLYRTIGVQLGTSLENAIHYDELKEMVDRDSLTGLLNHRATVERIENEIKRSRRSGRGFALLMMDIDGFKLYNDTYGHPAGDDVLCMISRTLSGIVRGADIIGRYGGDEFVVVLPNTSPEEALVTAERLQAAMPILPTIDGNGQETPVAISIGIASYPEDGQACLQLINAADVNMYASKRKGGNSITLVDSDTEAAASSDKFGVLDCLIAAVDNKDGYTRRHSDDVTKWSQLIGQQIGLPDERLQTLRVAALLHDVGKIGVPYRILRKPGSLETQEAAVVQQHSALGEMIIKEVPHIDDVAVAVGSHHERIDGRGYPRGTRGDAIPLLGRILAVADAFSAMTTDRPYGRALSIEDARTELQKAAGTQLDAELVAVFLRLLDEQQKTRADASDDKPIAGNRRVLKMPA